MLLQEVIKGIERSKDFIVQNNLMGNRMGAEYSDNRVFICSDYSDGAGMDRLKKKFRGTTTATSEYNYYHKFKYKTEDGQVSIYLLLGKWREFADITNPGEL